MTLKKIQMVNFRNATNSYNIDSRMAFIGLNGSGKSRIKDAIVYGLLGRLSDSKKNEDIFSDYSSGTEMIVKLQYDNGVAIKRGIAESQNKKGDITYKSIATVVEDGEVVATGVKAVNAWISENIPVPEVVLMFSEFGRMKTTERRKLLMEYLMYVDPTVETCVAYIDNYLDRPEDADADYYRIEAEIMQELRGLKSLKSMQSTAETNRSFHHKMMTDGEGAKTTIAKMKNQMEGDIQNKAAYQDELEVLLQKQRNLSQEIGKSNALQLTLSKNKVTKKELTEKLAEEIDPTEESTLLSQINGWVERLTELNNRLPEDPSDDIDALEERNAKLDAFITDFANMKAPILARISALTNEQAELLLSLENLETGEESTCGYSGSPCPLGKEKLAEGIKATIENVQGRIFVAKSEIDKISEKAVPYNKEYKANCDSIVRAHSQYQELMMTYNELYEEEIKALIEKKVTAEDRLKRIDECKSSLESKKQVWQESLDELNAYVPPQHEPVDKLQRRLDVASDRIEVLKEHLKAIAERSAAFNLQNKAALSAEESEVKHGIWKQVKVLLGVKGIQGNIIRKASQPFVDIMNTALESFGRTETFFIETVNAQGNEVLRFGWEGKNGPVNYASMSNGEKSILSVCMCYTFQTITDMPCKLILLDDIENLDTVNSGAMITGLSELDVDNVVVCGLSINLEAHNEFTVEAP